MLTLFSLIENIPTIYQIYQTEDSARKELIGLVAKYISEKNNLNYSYIVVDDQHIDIYVHQVKIGYFKILPIINQDRISCTCSQWMQDIEGLTTLSI
jgi:hypothetical protein